MTWTIPSFTNRQLAYMLAPNIISGIIYYATKDKYSRDKYKGGRKKVWFEPPPFTFFIVWFILFCYAGYFLCKAKDDNKTTLEYKIMALLFFGFLWMVIYGMGKEKESMLLFIPLIIFSISVDTMVYQEYNTSSFMWTGWCIFAAILQSHSHKN